MKKTTTSYASPEIVAESVLEYLAKQHTPAIQSFRLQEPPQIICRPWSTLYYLNVISLDASQQLKLIVKIIRFQHQETAETSWQSTNLLTRGQGIFDTMTLVYNHFSEQSNPYLRALRPLTYLPQINAVVMMFSDGVPMNQSITLRHLLTPRSRGRTRQMMHNAGQWLRCFHTIPHENITTESALGPSDIFQTLLTQVDSLRAFNVHLTGRLWEQTLAVLKQVTSNEQVGNHGDFHSGNVLTFADTSVLVLDTILERVDSPYYDLGRFVGDLRSRRSLILRFGLLPTPKITKCFRDAFLNGYFNEKSYDKLLLALYEGYFLFREWVDTLLWAQDVFGGHKVRLDARISGLIINPSFHRVFKQWLHIVNAIESSSELSDNIGENSQ